LAILSENSLQFKDYQEAILKAKSKNMKVILIHDEDSCKFPAYSEMPKTLVDAHVFDDIAISLLSQYEKETWKNVSAKRLAGGKPLPDIVDVFLSHRQATGQGIAMLIRGELLKLSPKLQIFLDVKAEFELHDLLKIVEKTKLFVFILTDGIWNSEYCLKGTVISLVIVNITYNRVSISSTNGKENSSSKRFQICCS
jgi:hypothetical protein